MEDGIDWVGNLLEWYRVHRRDLPWRHSGDIYRIWVSEVMLQQTQVATVIPYYERFLRRFPDVGSLAAADLQEVLKAWEGRGYYARARNLHRGARLVVERHGGEVPRRLEAFQDLPGVGPYVAAAVLSIADGQALAAVDGNVLRVYARWRGFREDVRDGSNQVLIRQALWEQIPPTCPGDFNQALMELGALVCTPAQPRCDRCPLAPDCRALREGAVAELPVKARRARPPLVKAAGGAALDGDRWLVQQRPLEGLLGGLWEFPGGKLGPGESPPQALRREFREELGAEPAELEHLGEVRHAYTHFKVVISLFACRMDPAAVHPRLPFRWVTLAELRALPLPAATLKMLPRLRAWLDRTGRGRPVAEAVPEADML